MDSPVKWWDMQIGEQIGNAGSEVARAIRRKNKNDKLGASEFCIHAIEMLAYTKQDPKNANRRKELSYAQEEILDYILGDNLYHNDDQSIMKWYDAFLR
ncbi:MAG: hypothetical protein LUE31_12660 [Lachnospiraceae bacterium]|nr:hypothetical protein [Lachnospiraceae bacterium]MCD8098842.1 hypothetical protein [Lachnospiraceae bacterium]